MAAITETVYVTAEEGHVMSEKVSSLATNIYKEFERMIKKYDEDVVKELMPLIVGLLEGLDQSLSDKQEADVELELLRDDNEQLLTQYEREKQLRKGAEQKYLEMEDAVEGEKKSMQDKLESLESVVRMLELKVKNSADHVSRMEEKEVDLKKEYTKLHERYTELFRTHMDYMERTKIVMGSERMEVSNSPRSNLRTVGVQTQILRNDSERSDNEGVVYRQTEPVLGGGFQLPSLRPVSIAYGQNISARSGSTPPSFSSFDDMMSPRSVADSNISLQSELGELDSPQSAKGKQKETKTCDQGQVTDSINVREFATATSLDHTLAKIVATTPELQEMEESMSSVKSNRSRGPKRNNESIFDELQSQDTDIIGDVDFGITGREVNPGDYASSVSDNFFGMGKELENLILENTELLETKNALNIVKDDLIAKVDELSGEVEILKEEINNLQGVKTKLNTRIKELEEELKKTKEELEKKNTATKEGEEEDDVPMAQRKRFTRVEMARVLMERNQYKERLMELQEAVRWTEMIRASREHPEASNSPQKQKKGSVWNFFSNLFSSSSPHKPSRKPGNIPVATIKYNAPTTQVQPVGDPNRRSREMTKLGDKAKAYEFLQDDLMSEKAKKEREKERQEQYKQVRAHVKKDDGRLQAYGWSLPAKFQPSVRETPAKREVPVPVPVYCRPILEKEPGMKIWCAAGVNLTGGKTRDGGSVVGASVFYSSPPESETDRKEVKDEVDRLNQELKDHEKGLKDAGKEQMSSLVWISHSSGSHTQVSVIDANSPGDILETFKVSSSPILCIASVAGALESDYPVDEEILKAESFPQYKPPPASTSNDNAQADNSGIGGITFVHCATGNNSQPASPQVSPVGSYKSKEVTPEHKSNLNAVAQALTSSEEKIDTEVEHKDKFDTESIMSERSYEVHFGSDDVQPSVFKARGSPANSGTNTPVSRSSLASLDRHRHSELIRDGLSPMSVDSDIQFEETDKMTSVLPTVWMGSQTGGLYVHSSVAQWRRCLYSVKLRDSILNIVHVKGRVLVALADGTISIFHRDTDGQWDLQNYHLLDLGKPHHSIRCMTVIANKHVWCGYRNKIHVIEPKSMTIEKTFDAHPRKESQVRQLAWVGDGVWVSIRLDSTLRLYHAYTHQHLQDVDIEPYVSKMLGTGKLGFSFVRITAMLISCNRLWIGTGNGVIISVPLSESNKQTVSSGPSGGRPGGIVRVYSDTQTDSVTPGTFIPYCTMAQAQLSFHGHRDAVKFFVSVPGSPRKGLSAATESAETSDNRSRHEAYPVEDSNAKLVLSGGEGYVDFRIGDGEDDNPEEEEKKLSLSKGDKSHLIVWEVTQTQ